MSKSMKGKKSIIESVKIANDNTEGNLTINKYTKFRKENNRDDFPSLYYIVKHKGWNKAKEELNLETIITDGSKYSKEYLIEKVNEYYEKYGETPNSSEYLDYIPASRSVLYRYFDSYYQVLMKANVPLDNIDEYKYKFTMPEFCSYCALKEDCQFDYNLDECGYYEEE